MSWLSQWIRNCQKKKKGSLNEYNHLFLQELLNAHLLENAIRDSSWFEKKNFMVNNYSVDYFTLYLLFRLLDEVHPKKVIEFGMGESSRLFVQYFQFQSKAEVVSVESDQDWLNFLQRSMDIPSSYKIHLLPCEKIDFREHETLRYQGDMAKLLGNEIEMIFLDGPLGKGFYHARTQILDLIPHSLNPKQFCLMIHDAERPGERRTITEILKRLEQARIPHVFGEYHGLKDIGMIVSPSLKCYTLLSNDHSYLTS